MKVAIVSPTTWQLVEKYAALFPGLTIAGPLADDQHDKHHWNDYRRKMNEWKQLGLEVNLDLRPYADINFAGYDVAIHSIETFLYTETWRRYCTKISCPILVKACWTKDPRDVAPPDYLQAMRHFPVLLEMPAHVANWTAAGFTDVNLAFCPVGEWWFAKPWVGTDKRALMVLSGRNAWRSNPSNHGLEIWHELVRRFPSHMHLHDGHEQYLTTPEMVELFRQSRVFINLDRPFGQGERPLTLAFTEALAAGLPVVARDFDGLSYRCFIDGNGLCSNDIDEISQFLQRCLVDLDFVRATGARSRQIAQENFSVSAVRERYVGAIERAQRRFRGVEKN